MRSSPSFKLLRVYHHSYRSLYFSLPLLLHIIISLSLASSTYSAVDDQQQHSPRRSLNLNYDPLHPAKNLTDQQKSSDSQPLNQQTAQEHSQTQDEPHSSTDTPNPIQSDFHKPSQSLNRKSFDVGLDLNTSSDSPDPSANSSTATTTPTPADKTTIDPHHKPDSAASSSQPNQQIDNPSLNSSTTKPDQHSDHPNGPVTLDQSASPSGSSTGSPTTPLKTVDQLASELQTPTKSQSSSNDTSSTKHDDGTTPPLPLKGTNPTKADQPSSTDPTHLSSDNSNPDSKPITPDSSSSSSSVQNGKPTTTVPVDQIAITPNSSVLSTSLGNLPATSKPDLTTKPDSNTNSSVNSDSAKQPSKSDDNDLSSFLSKDSATSTPFKVNSTDTASSSPEPAKTSTSNPDDKDDLASFLSKDKVASSSTPFKTNSTNLEPTPEPATKEPTSTTNPDDNLSSFLSKDNLTTSSIPFKFNSTNVDATPEPATKEPTSTTNSDDNLSSFLSKDNLTTSSIPFKFNGTNVGATSDPATKEPTSTTSDDNLSSFLSKDNVTSSIPLKFNSTNVGATSEPATKEPTSTTNSDDNLASILSKDDVTSSIPLKFNSTTSGETTPAAQNLTTSTDDNLASFLTKENVTSSLPLKFNSTTSGEAAPTAQNLTTSTDGNLASFLTKENVTSVPFKFNSTNVGDAAPVAQNLTTSTDGNLASFLTKENVTSVPFQFNSTNVGDAAPTAQNLTTSTDGNLASFLTKDNVTSSSIPFKFNSTNVGDASPTTQNLTTSTDSNLASFLSKDNVTSVPFKFNSTAAALTDVPSQLNSTNDDKLNQPSLLNVMNTTMISSPFKSNLTGDNTLDQASASLLSTPSKYNLTDSGSSNLTKSEAPTQPNLSAHLQNNVSVIDKDSTALTSAPLISNSTDLTESSSSNTTLLGNSNNSTNSTPYHSDPKPAPAFVPITSLFVNPRQSQAVGTSTAPTPAGTALPSAGAPPKKSSSTPFPSSWPRYIVPTNAPTSPPANSTLISILFTDALNWPWLVTNSNASSQVLVFMPQLIAATLQISEDQVLTQSLQAYQPANFNPSNEASMLTLWLGYIPTQYVGQLQAMIRAPQSHFYTNPSPVLRALAKTVDPSLPISTYEKKTPASQAAGNALSGDGGDSPTTNSGQKIAVIASVTTCGAAILAIGLVIAARQSRRRMVGRSQGSTASSSLRIGAPMIGSFQRGHDGQPVSVQSMEQVSALPISAAAAMSPVPPLAPGSAPNVRHEYGEARTTSIVQDPFTAGGPPDRASWWGRMSGILGGGPAAGGLAGPSRIDEHSYQSHNDPSNASSESAIDGFQGQPPASPPSRAPKRVQITRGADGLVSGIGRPVMKENSLFF
ncbi:hypothetical protein Pst134EA_001085 [Puccinia striiformis f. sp. tritici]|uniref:hypothetical protein n=1 Tax=Puccinia striiformis f. sp. tritici TaxID=168172 RepID=UPI0020084C5A|nr:hypothetical protein Pst134EA_001085 [Puccinia striiformis f. sp. tritici]KAH9474034.1 hypothetical protein Pst134EA_001085 [Puccinia striiformis f. sp. tritici]